jgi:prevent-host-death family protein
VSDKVPVSEARATMPELIGRVLDGEEITLTRHGEDVAVLISPTALRHRRNSDVFAAAERLRQQLDEARNQPLPPPRMSRRRADHLVREIRAERATR